MRPALHFTAASGWINDPHGVTWHGGRYHLFFQHVPGSRTWRKDIHWGHATSTDLLHWEEHPVAVAPGEGDDGIWSGSVAITDAGDPVLFYTSVGGDDLGRANVRVATPTDDSWHTWTKGDVVASPQRSGTVVFRDPMVLRDGDRWTMLVGAGEADGTATAEVFTSRDLGSWQYAGRLASRHTSERPPWTGAAWECPQVARAAGGDVLVVSVWDEDVIHHVAAAVGSYADCRFEPRSWQELTAGPGHYAATAFIDTEGRSCLLFWVRGVGDTAGAWTGAISVPYLVEVVGDRVVLTPHSGVEAARLDPDEEVSTALDIEWHPGGSGGLELTGSDGVPRARLTLDDGVLTVAVDGVAAPVTVDHATPMLRVLVDGPVLEVVASGGLVGLPLRPDALGVRPLHEGGELRWWRLG